MCCLFSCFVHLGNANAQTKYFLKAKKSWQKKPLINLRQQPQGLHACMHACMHACSTYTAAVACVYVRFEVEIKRKEGSLY